MTTCSTPNPGLRGVRPRQTISILAAALLGGVLLGLAFPGADLGPVAFIALVPLLTVFPLAGIRQAVGVGILCGFVFFSILLYWVAVFASSAIGILGVVAWLALSLEQGLFVGLFAAIVQLFWNRVGSVGRLLVVPSAWVLCEWLRSLGTLGMGWGDLGYSQWHALPVLCLARWTGVWGVSWLIVWASASLALVRSRTRIMAILAAVFVLVLANLDRPRPSNEPWITVGAVQGDLDQNVPWTAWRPSDPAYYNDTLDTYGSLIGLAARRKAVFCALPETALPGYPKLDAGLDSQVAGWAKTGHIAILAGAHGFLPRRHVDQNIAFFYSPDGGDGAQYAKQRLVPFGEYVPYRRWLPILNALHVTIFDLAQGTDAQPLIDAGPPIGKLGVAICYESTFPEYLGEQVRGGARLLTVITDDTWFGRTAAARQHLAMSALRSAETDRYLVRAAATGISAIFGPDGKEIAEVPIFTKGLAIAAVQPRDTKTFGVRYGDWFVTACGIVLLVAFLAPLFPIRDRSVS